MGIKKTFLLASIFTVLLLVTLFSEDVYKNNRSNKNLNEWKSIDRNSVFKIEIKNANKKTILKREGAEWRLTDPVDAEADADAVEKLLEGIEKIEIDSIISSNKEKRGMFQVDDSGIKVDIYAKDDKKLESFIIGKRGTDYVHSYIRKSESDNVYQAKGFERYQFDRDTKMWRNRVIIKFNKDEADALTLQSKNFSIVFKKEGEHWFITDPERHKADKNKMNTVLNILSNLNASDFEDNKSLSETSLDKPEFMAKVGSKDGDLGEIFLGKVENNNIYIKNADKEQIFIINSTRLDDLKKDINEFKEKENPSG